MPDQELALVAGRNPTKLEAWCDRHHPKRSTNNIDDVYNDPDIDAIYVALPPRFHAQVSAAGLEAGKTVLCEKPLSTRFEIALALQACASRTGRALYHATSFPFHPRSLKMRDTIRAGTLGTLRRITIACSASQILTRGDDHRLNAELGGGCLLDLGWYCVYATLWFTGLKPLRISAFGARDPSSKIWTSAQALVELEGGVIAHWDCGFDAAGRKWIEFAGSDASMICDDFLRPWDSTKPRYWIHGHDGKALCETVNSELSQEELMLHAVQHTPDRQSIESVELATETQRVLDLWEKQLVNGCNPL
jgi:predicted dehydrogenase